MIPAVKNITNNARQNIISLNIFEKNGTFTENILISHARNLISSHLYKECLLRRYSIQALTCPDKINLSYVGKLLIICPCLNFYYLKIQCNAAYKLQK